jgi:phosphoserine aminotransferase
VTAGPLPHIDIPPGLLPTDGRFGCGPSKVRPEAMAALAAAGSSLMGTSHRQAPVRNLVARVKDGLRDLFGLPDGYEVVLGTERRSQHLCFGEFSAKFAAAATAAPHLDTPSVVASPTGTRPTVEPGPGIDFYAFTHNETSTGVMAEVLRPAGTDPGALVAVDATSGAGGLAVDPAQFDAYYFAPQKCFASDGGLWLALLSPAALQRVERLHHAGRWVPASLDLAQAIDNSRKDQTLNTPALATVILMAEQLDWMVANGGMAFTTARCQRSSSTLYGWAESRSWATPFVAKPEERSHVVGTIDFDPAIDADTLAGVLRANGIVDTESYRKLGRNQLRIGLFPAIDPDDVAALTACIDHVVAQLG